MIELKEPDKTVEIDEDEDDMEVRCDLFGWSPDWLQRFANIKCYLIVFGGLAFCEHAIGGYMGGTISTVEKRFSLPSQVTGLTIAFTDVGGILIMFFLSYLGNRGRRTRWLAGAAATVALSCIIRMFPHFIYGPGEASKRFTQASAILNEQNSSVCQITDTEEECVEGKAEGVGPPIIFSICGFLIGAATSAYYTLGYPYLDDNANKNDVPWLLSAVFCFGLVGPTFGYMMASYVLKIYVDPFATPNIDHNDPRWIGAWWMGWIVFASILLLLSFFMLLFPDRLKNRPKSEHNVVKGPASFKDFKESMCRLLKNKVLVYNSVSSTLYIFGLMGYGAFMPKYMENQFNLSASNASFITGSVGLICTGVGVLVSGIVISYFKPSPRSMAAWNVIVETIELLGQFSFTFLGCPVENYQGFWDERGIWNMTDDCNKRCACGPEIRFNPVCSSDGLISFYSPCHAGCLTSFETDTSKIYRDCSCTPDGIVNNGACSVDCSYNFVIFLTVLCIIRFLGASGRAGNLIVQFRAVKKEDKSLSMAFAEFMVAFFAFIPAPIFFGTLLDYSCLVWGVTCGETGNCWLYDGKKMRYLLNYVSSFFALFAMLTDIGVWYHCKDLVIYEETQVGEKKPESTSFLQAISGHLD